MARDFTGIEFVLQRDLDGEFCERDVGEGSVVGIDAGDAGDEEVCFSEVEEGGVDEGGHGGGCVDFAFADGDETD